MHIFVLARKVILVLFTIKPIILSSGHFQYMDIDHTDHCKHWTCSFLTIPLYSDVSMVSRIHYLCIHLYFVCQMYRWFLRSLTLVYIHTWYNTVVGGYPSLYTEGKYEQSRKHINYMLIYVVIKNVKTTHSWLMHKRKIKYTFSSRDFLNMTFWLYTKELDVDIFIFLKTCSSCPPSKETVVQPGTNKTDLLKDYTEHLSYIYWNKHGQISNCYTQDGLLEIISFNNPVNGQKWDPSIVWTIFSSIRVKCLDFLYGQ